MVTWLKSVYFVRPCRRVPPGRLRAKTGIFQQSQDGSPSVFSNRCEFWRSSSPTPILAGRLFFVMIETSTYRLFSPDQILYYHRFYRAKIVHFRSK